MKDPAVWRKSRWTLLQLALASDSIGALNRAIVASFRAYPTLPPALLSFQLLVLTALASLQLLVPEMLSRLSNFRSSLRPLSALSCARTFATSRVVMGQYGLETYLVSPSELNQALKRNVSSKLHSLRQTLMTISTRSHFRIKYEMQELRS